MRCGSNSTISLNEINIYETKIDITKSEINEVNEKSWYEWSNLFT